MAEESIIPKHGGYRNLVAFRVAQLAYDVTVRFCDRYIDNRSRTHDQMVQAARSGVQNIAEGSQASATSKKMELKLTQVARASLEELRLDYEDFLRQRELPLWAPTDPRRQCLVNRRCKTADEVSNWIKEQRSNGRSGPSRPDQKDRRIPAASQGQSTPSNSSTRTTNPTNPELAANAALVLINVACALLDRQVASLAAAFESEGGFTERLYRVRSAKRQNRS